jgi:hypothetical protein
MEKEFCILKAIPQGISENKQTNPTFPNGIKERRAFKNLRFGSIFVLLKDGVLL